MNPSPRLPTWIVVAAAVAFAMSWSDHGRADAPPGRYTITNGTVLDTETLLTWEQTISATLYTWSDAQTYCTGLNLNGTGWRVPSMKELLTIVDERREGNAIDPTAFPNTPGDGYWTSTALAGSPSSAWFVLFFKGNTSTSVVTDAYGVRCVR